MKVMVELHGLWEATPAIQICRALADYSPYWVEDAIKLDSEDALARLRDGTDVPFAFGETLAGVHAYKRLFDSGAVDVVMFDFGWESGISEEPPGERPGGGLRSSHRAARLRRPGRPGRGSTFLGGGQKRPYPGNGEGLLHRLVQRDSGWFAVHHPGADLAVFGPRDRGGAEARAHFAPRCPGTGLALLL